MSPLSERIEALKHREKQQLENLKAKAKEIGHSLQPSVLLRNTFKDVTSSPDFRSNMINSAIGLGAGMLGKRVLIGRSTNIFKKITGAAVQFVLANLVRSKLPDVQPSRHHHNGTEEESH